MFYFFILRVFHPKSEVIWGMSQVPFLHIAQAVVVELPQVVRQAFIVGVVDDNLLSEQVAQIIGADKDLLRKFGKVNLFRIVLVDILDRLIQMFAGISFPAAFVYGIEKSVQNLYRLAAYIRKIGIFQQESGTFLDDRRQCGYGRARLDRAPRKKSRKFIQFCLDNFQISARKGKYLASILF